jgi:S-adenosylmethionine synthetase
MDKMLLCGGAACPSFGGGEVTEPMELYMGGRATAEHDGIRIPVDDIAVEACRAWLRTHLPALDLEREVRLIPKLQPGSGALRSLFSKGGSVALSNDTSCGAGFAPLTRLERAVLEVERTLNDAAVKRLHPAIGQDVKVMGIRHGSRVNLTGNFRGSRRRW